MDSATDMHILTYAHLCCEDAHAGPAYQDIRTKSLVNHQASKLTPAHSLISK